VQTRRLAASLDTTRSVALTEREKFPRKVTCILVLFFFKNPQKRPDAKVWNSSVNQWPISVMESWDLVSGLETLHELIFLGSLARSSYLLTDL